MVTFAYIFLSLDENFTEYSFEMLESFDEKRNLWCRKLTSVKKEPCIIAHFYIHNTAIYFFPVHSFLGLKVMNVKLRFLHSEFVFFKWKLNLSFVYKPSYGHLTRG